jgi:hypothetical protein
MKKMSDAMYAMLRNLASGREATAGLSGMSAHGGATSTWHALVRRGFVDWQTGEITRAGRVAIGLDDGQTGTPLPDLPASTL